MMFACVALMSACATSFTGSPYIEGGRTECEAKCAGQGLSMCGMVYMGEYSSACVCSVGGSGGEDAVSLDRTSAASAGAVAGVIMQMRAQESQPVASVKY